MSTKKAPPVSNRPTPLVIQVDPVELILHDGGIHVISHLASDQSSFALQIPSPPVHKPKFEFGLINILAKIFEEINKIDPNKPEGVVLRAMAKNFVTPETMAQLVNGQPIQAQKPAELHTPNFQHAMHALQMKYQNDPPKRDALGCVAAANRRALNTQEIFHVFRHLSDGAQLTPEQQMQIMQGLLNAVRMIKKDADEMKNRMANQGGSAFDMANIMNDGGMMVNPDGNLAARTTMPTVQKPEELNGLLEMMRDFWMAVHKAGQEPNLRDDLQRQMAQLMRNVGQAHVRTGRNSMAMLVDAKANRFLIQKLRSHPSIQADVVKMAALDKLAKADATGRALSPQELVEIFDALGKGVPMTPEMLKLILEFMVKNMRSMQRNPNELAGLQHLMAGGGPINPAEAIRVVSKANVQKPEETVACLDLFKNMFLAMAATKQTAALKDQHQRLVSETLRGAAQNQRGGGGASRMLGAGQPGSHQIDPNAYRMMLMKLRADQIVKADEVKSRAVEELAAAQATGKQLTQQQMLDIFRDLGRGVKMTPDMLKIILEHMCTQMRALTPNEKAELQKRFKRNPVNTPSDFVEEASEVRKDMAAIQQEAVVQGAFQVFPEGHKGFGHRPPTTAQSREVGMRAGPASVEWQTYKALGTQPPATEMARIVLVQSQLADVEKFENENTQKTLMREASDVTFRSILQPSVMAKYEQSLLSDKAAMSALQSLSRVGTMDDAQLGKRVDQLLTTLDIGRAELRNVMQQLVRDRLMTNDEAKDVERRCEMKMLQGGGKIKLSDLQMLLQTRKAGH